MKGIICKDGKGNILATVDLTQPRVRGADGLYYLDVGSAEVANFERYQLDLAGNYIGGDLRRFGFYYRLGEWVPVDKRYSAACEWHWASKAREMSKAS
jgi:hypothetical protein